MNMFGFEFKRTKDWEELSIENSHLRSENQKLKLDISRLHGSLDNAQLQNREYACLYSFFWRVFEEAEKIHSIVQMFERERK